MVPKIHRGATLSFVEVRRVLQAGMQSGGAGVIGELTGTWYQDRPDGGQADGLAVPYGPAG